MYFTSFGSDRRESEQGKKRTEFKEAGGSKKKEEEKATCAPEMKSLRQTERWCR
jgi:hypothetical protein